MLSSLKKEADETLSLELALRGYDLTRSVLRITTKGRYAVSISTVVFIYSNDDSDIKLDISLATPGNPKLKQQLEQQAEWKELKVEAKQEAPHDFRLDLDIQTLELEGEILTSTKNGKVVYRKR